MHYSIRRQLPLVTLLGLLSAPASMGGEGASDPASAAVLPKSLEWSGESESLIAPDDDPWRTPAERTGLTDSPSYDVTVDWLSALVKTSPRLRMASIGRSPEGRDIWMVIATREGAATPDAVRENGRPTILAQAGIHSGEIDGKDAGMMLLRDLTVRRGDDDLLARCNLLFVPIFSVDAHERRSPHGRINQRGPIHMGWRTNAANLNLNRDYAKADTFEMRAMLAALNTWPVDLYVDLHVTDGVDYQYDVTYGYNGAHAWSPSTATFLDETVRPRVDAALRRMGHVPGGLVFAIDDMDMTKGNFGWTAPPRFSNGYGDARHLATILVENHSLKPFRRRVLGTYVFLRELLAVIGEEGEALKAANDADRALRRDPLPLSFKAPESAPETIEFLGVRSRVRESEVTGDEVVEWLGEPITQRIPYVVTSVPDRTVSRPKAYWIPATWTEVIDRLALHGIRMSRVDRPVTRDVTVYRIDDFNLGKTPFEGRVRVTASTSTERREETFPQGSVRITTDQPLGDLAMLLLEPSSEDSLLQWGFFLPVLQRTEYAEAYVMEPTAQRMLDADPALRAEYEAALEADPDLADNPGRRLHWFYQRTPYYDDRWRLYPVARED